MRRVLSVMVAVSAVCVASLAVAAGPAMEYQLRINGEVKELHQLPAGRYEMSIEARVINNELAPDVHGGILQAAINVNEENGAQEVDPVRPPAGGFPPAIPELWDATFSAGLNLSSKGLTDFEDYDIFAHTMAFPPGDFGSNVGTYGANEWSILSTGQIDYLGGHTVLVLTAADGIDGQLLFGDQGGGAFGAAKPESAGTYRTTLGQVPEPATISLLALALLGCVGLGRRR